MTERIAGLRDLVTRFDGLFVDLWGVIHDGEALFPDALPALEQLRARATPVVFVSNSSRAGTLLEKHLATMGVDRSLYARIVSSGDVTKAALTSREPALFSRLPPRPRCVHVGDAEFVAWLPELAAVVEFVDAAEADSADLLLVTGSFADEAAVARALRPLEGLAARRVPLVCTNPDRVVQTAQGRVFAAGALAQAYQRLGAETFMYGKPYAPIFAAARRVIPGARRIAVVGDLLETDIRGARDAGLYGVLVTATGVNASALGVAPSEATLASLGVQAGVLPDGIIPRFTW